MRDLVEMRVEHAVGGLGRDMRKYPSQDRDRVFKEVREPNKLRRVERDAPVISLPFVVGDHVWVDEGNLRNNAKEGEGDLYIAQGG